jgi:mono/diheme cytochrome c family protein
MVDVRSLIALASITASFCAFSEDESMSFNWDVRPIFAEHCYECHGPDAESREAGLRFDERASLFNEDRKGGPVIDPDDPADSELISRITSDNANDRMPPSDHSDALSSDQIDTLRRWVANGAEYEQHWSLVKPDRRTPPDAARTDWPRNDIDRFILARLAQDGIAPSSEADQRTLVRRLYLDLIGLPPTTTQVEGFLKDKKAGAYERVVDELLESPHFGERWGRHWLDGARYADSNGYSVDSPRSIWPYRDWIIDAINDNKPFDEFVVEQIAGDMMPDATLYQRVATGFHRNTMINQEGGIDQEEFRMKAVLDRVNTTGSVFFGLTVGCAQCHTHKYDPITQDEFYGLFAFYNNDDERDEVVSTDAVVEERRMLDREANELEKDLSRYIANTLSDWSSKLDSDPIDDLPNDIQSILAIDVGERDKAQSKKLDAFFVRQDEDAQKQRREIDEIRARRPHIDKTMVLRARDESRETHFLQMGEYTSPGHVVVPGVPAALHEINSNANTSRLDLARWIVNPENPLTARVTVNRMWQRLFGRGIVETENDFGTQGSRPSHPALLDWLAVEFVENDWDVKASIRSMVASATYRQSSDVRADLETIDPDNRLLAKQSRIRLDAEIIRDAGLAVSQLLDPKIGGPSVYPPQPEGVMKLGQQARAWRVSGGGDQYRRGLYTHFWRSTPYPALTVFDAPDATTACTRRNRSTTPLQALTLLNDAAFHEMAMALAKRIETCDARSDKARIRLAFNWCMGRDPSARERKILLSLVPSDESNPSTRWAPVARTLLNLDEFITRE